jgi:hypothetical protein
MKRYAILLLLVLGLSTSAWGTQIGMGYTNTCLGMGQQSCWNPCPAPFPTPCPNLCPPPCPTPNPCPGTCPLPSPDLRGCQRVRVGLDYSGYNFGTSYGSNGGSSCGYGSPCFPIGIAHRR